MILLIFAEFECSFPEGGLVFEIISEEIELHRRSCGNSALKLHARWIDYWQDLSLNYLRFRFDLWNQAGFKVLLLCLCQVRSVAAESDRAYNGGPLEGYYYQQSSFTPLEAGPDGLDVADLLAGAKVEGQYANHLDWFTVDLEGEKSAMDGWILEQHANYVVGAVHRVFRSATLVIYWAKEHAHLPYEFSVFAFAVALNLLPGVNSLVVGG